MKQSKQATIPPACMKEKVVSIGGAYEGHKIVVPNRERAFIMNLQLLQYAVQYAARWRTRRGIHTVKVRPAATDIKKALATRKVMFFMISTSKRRLLNSRLQ